VTVTADFGEQRSATKVKRARVCVGAFGCWLTVASAEIEFDLHLF